MNSVFTIVLFFPFLASACQFTRDGLDNAIKEQQVFVENLVQTADVIARIHVGSILETTSTNSSNTRYTVTLSINEEIKGELTETIYWEEKTKKTIKLNCDGLYWRNIIAVEPNKSYLIYVLNGEILRARESEFPKFSYEDELEVILANEI